MHLASLKTMRKIIPHSYMNQRQPSGAWMSLMNTLKDKIHLIHWLLEKMGHLHTKTMTHLQAALLEHDFVIQYKKGAIMPADYLS
jgi:hypothetical protein